MKAQAHSLRPGLSCIVRRMKAVRRRFCETDAGVAYLTLHQGLGPLIALSRPRLYGLYLLGLKSLVSVKATDTGLRNLNILADNRLGESHRIGNPENKKASARLNRRSFYARNVAEPPITVLWGVAIGKPSGLSVYLFVRSFQPDSDPRPSIGNRERELW